MLYDGPKYINPLTDFGFKRIFGTALNKDLLISFLNALLVGEEHIEDIKYRNTEQFGANEDARKAVFAVYCQTSTGGRFIVEMQNVYQDFYKDRSIYYSSFPINEQGKRGDWNYELQPVYTIGILNFAFPDDKQGDGPIFREVKLVDIKSKEVFYDKLTYIYVELAKFNKTDAELNTMLDKWLFVLKNMSSLMQRPAALRERVFTKLFRTAEIAKFDTNELRNYEISVNACRDIKNGMDSAERKGMEKGLEQGRAEGRAEGRVEGRAEGRAEGRQEGITAVARAMKERGLEVAAIAEMTGLPVSEIEQL